ncbi:MAG: phosphatidylglycerophosphatase A [Thermodesulfovibrionales bacterium]|nr:phosphatidylglycerophosphatase A [Thermodesulfovibrionales bacterium]
MHKLIATVFFVGYIPFAPGTFGSLAGFLFIWLIKPSAVYLLSIIVVVFFLGIWSSKRAEALFGVKDSSPIVIDEFAGYLVSAAFLPMSAGYLIAAFFLFRFFDIFKPPPIRSLEGFKGGIGIMLDDIVAGIFANLVLQIWRLL